MRLESERSRPTGEESATLLGGDRGGPGWVDSHCHLQLIDEEPETVLERAPQVSWLVVPGVDGASSRAAVALAERSTGRVFAAVGLHPDHADRWSDELDRILELVPQAIAVGETGLDFYRSLSARHNQLVAFRALLGAAVDHDKPVIVHCRDAFREVHEAIEQTETGDRVIMHCWSGGPHWTRRFLELGVTFSFADRIITGTDDMVRRGAALVTPDRAMVETDAPHHCLPDGLRNTNEPADIGLVGASLSLVWKMTCDEVAEATTSTARRVFRC